MRFWHVFAILLVLGNALGAVQIFWPVATSTGGGESVFIGRVSPGHEILIVTDRGPEEDPYTEVSVTPDWLKGYSIEGDRMYIRIAVPRTVSGSRQFCVNLAGEFTTDSFCPTVLVTSGTVDFDVQENVVRGAAGRYVPVATLIKNRSAGETDVRISCSLGEKYCKPVVVHLRSGDIKEPEIRVMYPFPGMYRIKIRMDDLLSGESNEKDVEIVLLPSVENSMRMLRWGLPLYVPFLLPALAITSLVG